MCIIKTMLDINDIKGLGAEALLKTYGGKKPIYKLYEKKI